MKKHKGRKEGFGPSVGVAKEDEGRKYEKGRKEGRKKKEGMEERR